MSEYLTKGQLECMVLIANQTSNKNDWSMHEIHHKSFYTFHKKILCGTYLYFANIGAFGDTLKETYHQWLKQANKVIINYQERL